MEVEALTITTLTTAGVAENVMVYHLFQDPEITEQYEVSRMPNRSQDSITFNHGKIPDAVRGTIICRGGITVPVQGSGDAITQEIGSLEQLANLRATLGKIVIVDFRGAPPGGVRGVLRQGKTKPALKWDDGVSFEFDLIESQSFSELSQNGLSFFGELELIPLEDPLDGGPGQVKECVIGTKRTISAGPIVDPFIDAAKAVGSAAKLIFWEAPKAAYDATVTFVEETAQATEVLVSTLDDVTLISLEAFGIIDIETENEKGPC